MRLTFLYGPPAAGKYTIARKLSAVTGDLLFHNHLVVDAVGAVFPFGSESFKRLREAFWLAVFEAAAREDRSLIFTFQPEDTVAPDFAERVQRLVAGQGGETVFLHLKLSAEGQRARIANANRARFGKLRDLEILNANIDQFAACERAMPVPELVIDTETTDPDTAAQRIADLLATR